MKKMMDESSSSEVASGKSGSVIHKGSVQRAHTMAHKHTKRPLPTGDQLDPSLNRPPQTATAQ